MARRSLGTKMLGIALALAAAIVVVPASADTPKGAKHDAHEAKKEVKAAAKDLKKAEKEAKADGHGAADDKKVEDARAKLKEAIAKMRETRAERRKEHQEKVHQKYGKLLENKDAQEEVRQHARTMARLHRMESLAKTEGQADIEKRVDELKKREQTRHDKRMGELQSAAKEVKP